MENLFKILVLFDSKDNEDIFRKIEISSKSTFEELHNIIKKAFDIKTEEMASFYMSNDDWDKGDEIPFTNISLNEKPLPLMSEIKLEEKIKTVNQKLLYVFDFLNMWCFYIDIIEISKIDKKQTYPKIVLSHNKSPDFLDNPIFSEHISLTDENDIYSNLEDDGDDNLNSDIDSFEDFS